MQILSLSQAEALMQSAPPREDFGPFTEHPCIVLKLDDAGNYVHLRGWLRDLPCPVLGIGEGEIGESCDALYAIEIEAMRSASNIEKWPLAAMVLAQHLRASEHLDMQDALIAESFAFAALQQGPEFNGWLKDMQAAEGEQGPALATPDAPVLAQRKGNALHLTMNNAESRNTVNAAMRDALCEALDLALVDTDITQIVLTGEGRYFSNGGDVSAFGQVSDPATAHWIRSLRLPAHRLARLSEWLHVHVNGPAIGAGVEMAAFGGWVTASADAWFQLPELKYGLIPGAGGTVSIARRMGRQRTARLAFSMKRMSAQKALKWGLVDEIV